MSTLPHLDSFIWGQVATHLQAHDLLHLFLAGSKLVTSKIARAVVNFEYNHQNTPRSSYADLADVISLAGRLLRRVESFSFKGAPLELVWASNWATLGSSLQFVRHLKLDFCGSLNAFFSQDYVGKALSQLESLHLCDPTPGYATIALELSLDRLPRSLRSLHLLPKQFCTIRDLNLDHLPESLETFHISALLSHKHDDRDFHDLRFPSNITDLSFELSSASMWRVSISSFSRNLRSLDIGGRVDLQSPDSNPLLRTNSIDLSGWSSLDNLHTLKLRESSITTSHIAQLPRSLRHIEIRLDPSGEGHLPSVEFISALKRLRVPHISHYIAKWLTGGNTEAPSALTELNMISSNYIDSDVIKLTDCIKILFVGNVSHHVLPASLTELHCDRLEYFVQRLSSFDNSQSHPMPKSLSSVHAMYSISLQCIKLLPTSLTSLSARLPKTEWNALMTLSKSGRLPSLTSLGNDSGLPWALLGEVPHGVIYLSFVLTWVPEPLSQLEPLKDLKNHVNMRCLRLRRETPRMRSVPKADHFEASRLLVTSLPPALTDLSLKLLLEFPLDVEWPSTLRSLWLEVDGTNVVNLAPFLALHGGALPRTLLSLPQDLTSLRFPLITGLGLDLTAHPCFPKHISDMSKDFDRSKYFANSATRCSKQLQSPTISVNWPFFEPL